MKAMKGLGMSKMLGNIKRKTGSGSNNSEDIEKPGDGPEALAAQSVTQFCKSGPKGNGDEVLYLPAIVDAAESSPLAAAECARLIRKYMSKDYSSKASVQYNAVMLIRILNDNPGPTFTRNFDKKFVDTAKELLRGTKDPSVRQILMETLDALEATKSYDETLAPMLEMWKQEKERAYRLHGQRMPSGPDPRNPYGNSNGNGAPQFVDSHSQNYFARSHSNRQLPSPEELASRLEEARTSAKLLEQVVINTPPQEILDNELIKEFADRCLSASRSVQTYMVAEDPAPDNDTMESLIDTNEQLQRSLHQHKRAVLGARKTLGIGERPSAEPSPAPEQQQQRLQQQNGTNGTGASGWQGASSQGGSSSSIPSAMPSRPAGNGKGKATELYPAAAVASGSSSNEATDDPFRDPEPAGAGAAGGSSSSGGKAPAEEGAAAAEQRMPYEPFHPGHVTATPSYLGRQDSALGKVAMSGAAASPPHDERMPPPINTRAGERPPQDAGGDEDDDSMYESTPKRKEPMYRY